MIVTIALQCWQRGTMNDQNDGDTDIEVSEVEAQTFPAYVNVYEVTQGYGGSEEGGWWYFEGEPLESVKVHSQDDLEGTLVRLRASYELDSEGEYIFKDQYDHPSFDRGRNRSISSSCGRGYEYQIKIQERFARPWPEERPHYE